MRTQDVERLIAKYLDGQTSPEEEKRLALALDLAIERGDAPQEWRVVAQMLGEFTLGEALYDKMLATRRRQRIGRWASLAVAASVALLLGLWLVPQAEEIVEDTPIVAKTIKAPAPQVEETPIEKEVPMIAEAKPVQKPRIKRTAPTIAEEAAAPEEVESIPEEPIAEEVPLIEDIAEEKPVTEEIDIEELRRKYSKEIAQVEQKFLEWGLKQSISRCKMEVEIVKKSVQQNIKHSEQENNERNNIIIHKPLSI